MYFFLKYFRQIILDQNMLPISSQLYRFVSDSIKIVHYVLFFEIFPTDYP
jgi:hypothetical protein